MFRRSILKAAIAGAALFAISPAFAADAKLELNKDYQLLNPAQPGAGNGQIEVIEFFSYGCPHCAAFDPKLSKWRAAQGKDVVFRRIPVSFGRPEWAALGRLHVTLAAMGLAEKLDPLVFDAVHKSYLKLNDEPIRNDWLAKQGVDVKKFNDTWRSFGIESKMRQVDQAAESYRVQSVPSLIIDGRYVVMDGRVQGEEKGHDRVLENATGLVAKVRAEKAKK